MLVCWYWLVNWSFVFCQCWDLLSGWTNEWQQQLARYSSLACLVGRSCMEQPVHSFMSANQLLLCPPQHWHRTPIHLSKVTWRMIIDRQSVMPDHMAELDQLAPLDYCFWCPRGVAAVLCTESLVLFSLCEIWSSFLRCLFSNACTLYQQAESTFHIRIKIMSCTDVCNLWKWWHSNTLQFTFSNCIPFQ